MKADNELSKKAVEAADRICGLIDAHNIPTPSAKFEMNVTSDFMESLVRGDHLTKKYLDNYYAGIAAAECLG